MLTRRIHTSRAARGFMDWFKMKQQQQKKKPAETLDSVIAKAEEGEITVTKLDKIEFIGKKGALKDDRPLAERLQGFHVKHWLNKTKMTDVTQFDKLIIDEYNKLTQSCVTQLDQVDLSNLNTRFQVSKQVQAASGYLIPDLVLTRASSGEALHAHFDKLINGTPNAHHLSIDDLAFTSNNVYVQPHVTSRQRKTKFRQLLKEAKLAQEQKTEELIQGVRA